MLESCWCNVVVLDPVLLFPPVRTSALFPPSLTYSRTFSYCELSASGTYVVVGSYRLATNGSPNGLEGVLQDAQ